MQFPLQSSSVGLPEAATALALGATAIYFIVGRSRLVRYSRRLITPTLLSLLVYRVILLNERTRPKSILHYVVNTVESVLKSIADERLALLAGDVLGIAVAAMTIKAIGDIFSLKFSLIKKQLFEDAYSWLKLLPPVRAVIDKEQQKIEEHFESHLKNKSRAIGVTYEHLPQKGLSDTEIIGMMGGVTAIEDKVWQDGKVSGGIYHGGEAHIGLLNKAFSLYSIANPLHPDIWPSCMKFEAEVIAMTAALVGGGSKGPVPTVCGCTTSGGTESIILAIKAHRDYYCKKHNIQLFQCEMVACVTAHAAVDKACDMLGIRLIKVPMNAVTCRADVSSVRRACGPNTIMIYASAPTFPQGAIDPIAELAQIARAEDIGLHVDCCLGGFVLPFARRLGYSIPDFDFSVPGVTSMSLDTHKYGYALKGASVLLYRHPALRHAQYFCYADWTGGLYTTPTLAGSRSGGLIAQCWASLVSIGEEGFLKHTKDLLETTRVIAKGVAAIPEIALLGGSPEGTPDAMIVCFAAAKKANGANINIYAVSDRMGKRGWSLNPLQSPACVHICCTLRHVGREKLFLDDMRACVAEVVAERDAAIAAGINKKDDGNAAIYGMTSSLPPGPVNDLLKAYNDVVLKT